MIKELYRYILVALICMSAVSVNAQEFSGYVSGQYRLFFQDPLDPNQSGNGYSLAAQPEFYYDWGNNSILVIPFFRFDQHDERRTHWDIRELYWQHYSNDWELKIGIGKVFWGVTESQHLVDIVNQTDFVENIDGEDKLGQPMVELALIFDWGTFNLFALTGFRERTFPGLEGRLRFPTFVNTEEAYYESSKEYKHIDFAVRYSHYIDNLDIGLSYFYGTSRDPNLLPNETFTELVPFYSIIQQVGLDAQLTTESGWILKWESIYRKNKLDNYFAFTGGFEYTFTNISESGLDVGIIGEYLYDERRPIGATGEINRFRFPPTPFYNHIFVGSRLAFNDVQSTELLLGGIVSLDNQSTFLNVEGSRRLGDSFKIYLEYRGFLNLEPIDIFYGFRNDSYLQLELEWYF